MNLRQMAALNVAKFIGSAVVVGVVNTLAIEYFGLATVGVFWAVVVFAYMIKITYEIEVAKLERLNALRKIKDSE